LVGVATSRGGCWRRPSRSSQPRNWVRS